MTDGSGANFKAPMKITIEMDGNDLKEFLTIRDGLLKQIDDLTRTPAHGSAENRATKILENITSLTPDQRNTIRESIIKNVLG